MRQFFAKWILLGFGWKKFLACYLVVLAVIYSLAILGVVLWLQALVGFLVWMILLHYIRPNTARG